LTIGFNFLKNDDDDYDVDQDDVDQDDVDQDDVDQDDVDQDDMTTKTTPRGSISSPALSLSSQAPTLESRFYSQSTYLASSASSLTFASKIIVTEQSLLCVIS